MDLRYLDIPSGLIIMGDYGAGYRGHMRILSGLAQLAEHQVNPPYNNNTPALEQPNPQPRL